MTSYLNIFVDTPQAERPPAEKNRRGQWEYEGTEIPAVGARDLTLGEELEPLTIGRPGEEPIAVLLPAFAVEANPRLEWARHAGKEFEGTEEKFFQIPFSLWQEHEEEVVGPWLPEHNARGLTRSLAIAEREFRFAQQALEASRLVRNCIVVLATRLGLSRRQVGESVGLSLGRVQQLNEDPPEEVVQVVEEVLEAAELVAKNIGVRPCPREDVPKPRALIHAELDGVIEAMLLLGLLEEAADGLQLTSDGATLIDASGPRKRKPVKTGKDRDRAGKASG